MGIADTQRTIARTMGIQGEIERSILGDTEIADSMDYVAQQLEKPAQSVDRAITYFDDHNRAREEKLDRDALPTHVDTRPQSSKPRETTLPPDDARRHTTTDDDAYHRAAIRTFDGKPWTIKKMASALDIGETAARELKNTWQDEGLIKEAGLGRWYFVGG